MPNAVYRFRFSNPIEIEQLRSEINDPAAVFTDDAGGVISDVTADVATAADLIAVMERRGFEYVSTNPVASADDEFAAGLASDLSRLLILRSGGVVYNRAGCFVLKRTL